MNSLNPPTDNFEWDEKIIQTFNSESTPEAPFQISAHGYTYTHIPDTETFFLDDPSYSITALKVMKSILPDVVRSQYRSIQPPPEFLLLGNSSRFKIIKAVQAHHYLPPPTPDTEAFIPFFEVLSENVQGHWTVQQQYSAAKWACRQNLSEASSLLLNYGWSPRFDEPMAGSSIHSLTIREDGVFVDMTYTHTLQERLDAACSAILLAHKDLKRRLEPSNIRELQSVGLRQFYYFKGKNVSLNNTYVMVIKTKIHSFIEELTNPLKSGNPVFPQIDEPEDLLDNQTFLLRWDDFVFVENPYSMTEAALNQRRVNGEKLSLEVAAEKLKYLPRGIPIKRKDLPKSISDRNLAAWKKYGILESPKYGYYLITLPEEGDEK